MMKNILAMIAVALLATTIAAQERRAAWNFDADETGKIAKGFTNEVGEWNVVVDPTAPSSPNVLAQLAKNSGSTFNIALVSDTNHKDLEVLVKMKAVAGKEDQGGGLIWRAKDTKNYYIARFNPLEDNYCLYKVEKGKRVFLKSAEVKRTEGWHQLRVFMKGDLIQCFYDDKLVLEVKDSTFQGPGKIGLWTKADAQSHFDDLTVSEK